MFIRKLNDRVTVPLVGGTSSGTAEERRLADVETSNRLRSYIDGRKAERAAEAAREKHGPRIQQLEQVMRRAIRTMREIEADIMEVGRGKTPAERAAFDQAAAEARSARAELRRLERGELA